MITPSRALARALACVALVTALAPAIYAQGAGWTYNPASKNPVTCAQDKTAAATIQGEIAALTLQRGSPQYAGSASTLYVQAMQGLRDKAAEIATNERTVCGGWTYTGAGAPSPTITDISPIVTNGTKDAGPSPSGLTVALAGDVGALYAVSLDGGVWKSQNGGVWTRLRNSPRYAHSIAIDPANSNHLVVGERGSDAISPQKNDQIGLWESLDSGESWNFVFDPLTQTGCTSQAIPSVTFDQQSNVFFATTCGIGQRASGSSAISFKGNPRSIGAITAVTASETKIWARTATELLIPQTDGSWQAQAFPPNMQPSADQEHPAHDEFALAAFDQAAYFPCCDDASLPKKCGNLDDLGIFRAQTGAFALLPNVKNGKPLLGCSGQGLGGSRFVRAFTAKDPGNGDKPTRQRLFYSSTEEIYESVSVAADGGITAWTRPLGATCFGCTNQDPVHTDFWDFLLAPDGNTEWISNDGGVYRRNLSPSGPWRQYDQGLSTHHAHMLELTAQGDTLRLLYPTSDDDAWFSNGSGWGREDVLGDVNWTAGDYANPNIALAVLRTGACLGRNCAALIGFGKTIPGGKSVVRAQLSDDINRDGPEFFEFIQSLPGESPKKFALDAIMLATLPLQFTDSKGTHDVKGPLGVDAGSLRGTVALLRNADFASNPDIEHSKGKGWTLFADNLPAGASRMWVAGGHTDPVAYVMTTGSGDPRLFKASHVPIGDDGQPTSWTELNVQGNVLAPQPYPASGMLDGSNAFGPVFVNPYNSDEVYVLTSSGVMVSESGGFGFAADPVLTNLITANGKYSLTGAFDGGNSTDVKKASRAISMGTLADITFDPNDTNIAVAVSPFSGLFFKDSTGAWYNLTQFIPTQTQLLSDARLFNDYIYVTTEGSGLFEVSHYPQLLTQVKPEPQ